MKRFFEIMAAVAMALLAIIVFACGPSEEQKTQEFKAAVDSLNNTVTQTYTTVAITAEYPNVKLDVTLTDPIAHADLLTETVANFFLAKYIQQTPANNGKDVLKKVKDAQGKVNLNVTDVYGKTYTAELTPDHLTGLYTATNSTLVNTGVKDAIANLFGSQLSVPAKFKLSGEVTASLETSFITCVIPVKAIDVANLTQGNISFYHQDPLYQQWKDLGGVAAWLKDIGIEGIRIRYADVDSDMHKQQAFRWRDIFELAQ